MEDLTSLWMYWWFLLTLIIILHGINIMQCAGFQISENIKGLFFSVSALFKNFLILSRVLVNTVINLLMKLSHVCEAKYSTTYVAGFTAATVYYLYMTPRRNVIRKKIIVTIKVVAIFIGVAYPLMLNDVIKAFVVSGSLSEKDMYILKAYGKQFFGVVGCLYIRFLDVVLKTINRKWARIAYCYSVVIIAVVVDLSAVGQ